MYAHVSAFYDDMIETALELITEFGEPVTWVQVTDDTVFDENNPLSAGDTVKVDYPVDIAFLPVDKDTRRSIQARTGTLIPEGTVLGYMGQTEFTPKLKDQIIRDGKQITVRFFDVYAPAGDVVLYVLELQT